MDHKLAIVIVPCDSRDPVQASRELLDRFQRAPRDREQGHFKQKFRFKRVGGWFDGLVNGQVGQERWSTVLRMLLEGAATNDRSPFAGFGPETGADIERRIEADNTLRLDDISSLAPCSIIVTPTGEWAAHRYPESLDEPSAGLESDAGQETEAWARLKRGLFLQYRGFTAVAWGLSWYFIGIPPDAKAAHRARMSSI